MENKYTGLSKKEVEYNQNLYGTNEITYKNNKDGEKDGLSCPSFFFFWKKFGTV